VIFYVHGFNSAKTSDSGRRFSAALGQPVVCLEYDSAAMFHDNAASLSRQFLELAQGPCLLAGTSMGGFFASLLAHRHALPCVLFNPVVNPVAQLAQFVGSNVNYCTGKEYEFTLEALESYRGAQEHIRRSRPVPTLVFASSCDELLRGNMPLVRALYGGRARIVATRTAHRIADFSPFIPLVREYLEKACEPSREVSL
jgi:predicted esterase YcpF (UPF0227 family)